MPPIALVNLTGRTVVLKAPNGTSLTIQPDGLVARVKRIDGGPRVAVGAFPARELGPPGEVEHLPPPKSRVRYVVTVDVLERLREYGTHAGCLLVRDDCIAIDPEAMQSGSPTRFLRI